MSAYAASVIKILREHFPDVRDPVVEEILTGAIEQQEHDARSSFEFIVDDPFFAKWRLKADSEDRRRVRLTCYRMHPRPEDSELCTAVNAALSAIPLIVTAGREG